MTFVGRIRIPRYEVTASCFAPRCTAAGNGILMWMPLNAQPVTLTIMVTDQQFSSFLTPVIQLCSCLNGGTCQYGSIAENHLQGKFQVSALRYLSLRNFQQSLHT